jgi:hypothetical protein
VRQLRRLFSLTAVVTLLGGTLALVAAAAPAASAAPAAPAASSSQDGWVRCAHLSPDAPAVDVYMYPFGKPASPTVLRHVAYGAVSGYMAIPAGQYTVAMRAAGAPASSAPVLSTSFSVSAGKSYTVAGVGPASGLRLQVFRDEMTTPAGKTLVRVFQASLKQHTVTVSFGSDVLARSLAFGTATSYQAVEPGTGTVEFTAAGARTSMPVDLAAGTVHTIVVLDGGSTLRVDNLTDAAGSQVMPSGGAATGFGGMAAQTAGPDLTPWLVTLVAGAALALAGLAGLRRSRGSATKLSKCGSAATHPDSGSAATLSR